jgi:glycosyltransferase involved in cell wall biosynthesis
MPKLCLNMIVKNESKIIRRLLDSVANVIDSYCICDTGSTDNTVELITSFFQDKKIPGKVVIEPFQDFAYNRTFALKQCETMENADYILLLDADMVFWLNPKISPEEFKNSLLCEVYHIFQGSEDFYYKNTRIVKNRCDMTYWGVTHEYVKTPEWCKVDKINKEIVFINDIGDGGSKADKFLRDIRLLKKGLEETPNNERYTFYLANSYRDSGQFDEAIETFKKRIQLGGWYEEIWHSYYSIGKCYKYKNDMANAIYYWMEAYNFFPNRIENLFEIVNYYRNQGKNRLAYSYFELADYARNKYPDRDYLFLQKDIYDYKLDYEFSIIGYYCNDHKRHIPSYCMKVINHPSCDENTGKNVLSNYKFYASTLKEFNLPNPNIALLKTIGKDLLKTDMPEYVTSTPSLCINANGELVVNVRYVNYKIDANGGYVNGANIGTKNVIATYDIKDTSEWKKKNEFVLKYNTELDNVYVGLEDIRLFALNDQIYYNANRGLDHHKIMVEHGVIDMDGGSTNSGLIRKENQNQVEKNWVLFNDDSGKMKIIYNWSPLVIGNIAIEDDFSKMQFVKTHQINTPHFFRHLRGSTNGLVIGNEIWFICHTVSYESRRYYYHLFVALDKNTFQVKKYSPYFTFDKNKVEYTLGFVHFKDSNRFLIGYSIMDSETEYITLSKSVVDDMMIRVD